MTQSPAAKRSDRFARAQEEALLLIHEALENERKSKQGLIPQPDCYLFGVDSIDTVLYEKAARLLVLLCSQRDEARSVAISHESVQLMTLLVNRRALESLEATGQLTLMHPLIHIRAALEEQADSLVSDEASPLEALALSKGER